MSRKKPINKEKFRAAIEWHNIKFSASNFEKLWQELSRHGNLELDKMNTNVEKLLAVPKKQATMASKDVQKKLMKVLEQKFTHIRDAFHAFDTDNSGSVTPDELRKALAKYNFVLSDEGFAQIMDGVDLSHDGKVSFAEFNKKYGSATTGSFKGSILADYHDLESKRHNKTLHARDKLVNTRFASADYVHKELAHIFESKFNHLYDAFKQMDADKTGSLEPGEFKTAIEQMANVRLKDTEYAKLCKKFNLSPRDNITYQIFVKDFAKSITGNYDNADVQTENERGIREHKAKLAAAKNVNVLKLTAEQGAKKYADALGIKFKHLRAAFKSMDGDNSGAIEEDEFRKDLKNYNIDLNDSEFQKLVRKFDRDPSGRITYKAFEKQFGGLMTGTFVGSIMADDADKERKRMLKYVHKHDAEQALHALSAKEVAKRLADIIRDKFGNLRKAFLSMDSDNSDSITTKEFRQALERHNLILKDDQFKELLKSYGIKGGLHGKFHYREFEKNFAHLISGKFEGHAISDLNDKILKQHQKKVLSRQKFMAIPVGELEAPSMPAPKPAVAEEETPAEPTPKPKPKPKAAKPKAAPKPKPAAAKKTPTKPVPGPAAKRRVLLDNLIQARAKLKKLFKRQNKRLLKALLAMDLTADGALSPFELKRVLEQFKIFMADSDFKKLIRPHYKSGRVDYVGLAKTVGGNVSKEVAAACKAEKEDNREEILAQRNTLREAESYLKDKLRNAYVKVMKQLVMADLAEPPRGWIKESDFTKILARVGGCRLTKAELWAINNKYKMKTRGFTKEVHIDYHKFNHLFDDLREFVDMSNPETKQQVEINNKKAETYLRDKLRNAYPKLLRAFKALESEGSTGMSHAAFKRLLSRFGGVRFTDAEWAGFVRKYDQNSDGQIDFEELRSLFGDMIDRDSKKVDEKKVFYQKQVAERKARKERAKAIREKMRGALVDVTEVEQLLAVQFRNNIGKAKATFKVLDLNGDGTLDRMEFQRAVARFGLQLTLREMDALMAKYSEGRYTGIKYQDFFKIISSIPKDSTLKKAAQQPVVDKKKLEKAKKMLTDIILIKYTDAHKAFKHIDENNSNRIELEEFRKYLDDCNIALSADEQNALMDSYDSSGTRTLGFGDFVRAFGSAMTGSFEGNTWEEGHKKDMVYQHSFDGKKSKALTADQLLKELAEKFEHNFKQLDSAFRAMDLDGSGKLEYNEFKRALERFNLNTTEDQFALLTKKYDTDGDGTLSFHEFQKHFAKHIQGEFEGNEWAEQNEDMLKKQKMVIQANAQKAGVISRKVPFSPIRSMGRRGLNKRELDKLNGTFPPISARRPRTSDSRSSRPRTSASQRPRPRTGRSTNSRRAATAPSTARSTRSLTQAKRMALQKKLLKAEKKHMGRAQTPSGNGGGAAANASQIAGNVYARWRKLRSACVAVDKNRKGVVNAKAFVKVMAHVGVGRPNDIRSATSKWLALKGGVPYNDFIREIISQFSS